LPPDGLAGAFQQGNDKMKKNLPNIGLSGRTGAGKSAAAQYLHQRYGYVVCQTGAACRQIAQRLFATESKSMLNRINDAMRAIDPNVWIKVALSEAPLDQPLVVDSVRFSSNLELLRARSFVLLRIRASTLRREQRLRERGQEYDFEIDDLHESEREIENERFDYELDNESADIQLLYRQLDRAVSALGST
jgi:cytidylate kinase